MEANKILSSDVLDIIFEGKNKAYGAYYLRKGYKRTLRKALVITGGVIMLVMGGTVLAGIINKNDRNRRPEMLDTTMTQLRKEDPAPTPQTPPPPKAEPPKLDLKQVEFTPPVVVKDDLVKPDEVIRDIDPDAAISNKTVESNNTNQVVQAPVDEPDTKVLEVKKADDENAIVTFVQIEAAFPGGDDAWRDYLRRTLNANTPIDNGATAGKYTVVVKFVVSKDGSVSNVQCENDPGFGMCDEAVRVIKRTRNWTPAMNNGKNVNAYRRQPVVFLVEE